ncbi:MAG: metallophosphoesterase [Corynebacterium sp.]|uniref:metallophosphoesterase family protein n=1 Tax=Corynebacterium sp. TaxID=1720 RepID=UPI0026E0ADDB|nr:metallophosphoesterase [Corynebacterium sp.]MDO5670190.1 metallophosphoesterase [Corynebacterium sp.]
MVSSEWRIAQFTDLHLSNFDQPDGDFAILREGFRVAVEKWGVQAILVTGDLVQRGSNHGYSMLRALFAACPVPVIPALGNHDDRQAFMQSIQPLPQQPPEEGGVQPFAGVVSSYDLDIIVLDSNVNDDGNGRLSDSQLSWLSDRLVHSTSSVSVLVVHHPIFTSPLQSLHRPLMEGAERLSEVISNSKVRCVLSGHYHHAGAVVSGHTLGWSSPAFCWETDLSSDAAPVRLNHRHWSLVRISHDHVSCVPIRI